ncbi:MAG: PEP-utilizing enzyme [Candidatus Diapherotrites archaeon]|nr:PEP-utilizing enzyme [Candidatus Diapherotrites archaeon]
MKTDFMFVEEIPNAHPFVLEGVWRFISTKFEKEYGGKISTILAFEKGTAYLYINSADWERAGKSVFEKVLSDPDWMLEKNKLNEEIQAKLYKFYSNLRKTNFSKFSKPELVDLLQKWLDEYEKGISIGWIDMSMEFPQELLSTYLKNYLKQQISKNNLHCHESDVFVAFTTPVRETWAKAEEKSILKICLEVKDKYPSVDFEKLPSLEKHFQKFRWLAYMYIGPAQEKSYYLDLIHKNFSEKVDFEKELKKLDDEPKQFEKLRKKYLSELKFDEKHKKLLQIAENLVWLKDYRKNQILFAFYAVENLLKEISKKFNISLNQLRFVTPFDAKKYLLSNFSSEELNTRYSACVYLFDKGKNIFYVGEEAKKFHKSIKPKEEFDLCANELRGSSAVPGKVKGRIKLIILPEDMYKMNKGDILVAHATNPDVVPAMKKASAIIADVGGLTCHAAIVSREMGIPCIVGTKYATKILKDNDLVEVDATNGIIKILERAK